MSLAFRAFIQFNHTPADALVSSTSRLSPHSGRETFGGTSLPDRCARALVEAYALPVKEIVESFEMFERVRDVARKPTMIDLCAGHGLLGVVFAAFERSVERVVLIDRATPKNHERVMAAMAEVAPWVKKKVERRTVDAEGWEAAVKEVGEEAAVVSAHACGELTDQVLAAAVSSRLPVAVMPCCYPWRTCPGPDVLRGALGVELAHDVDRTYRLERQGYRVLWRRIPESITKMNRIIVGRPG